ncbi:DUF2357 domain-containing protein [Maribacter polysiphoniae]|uniref:DUF2357 domain-containing protein n=1 Tax=Maribacter polysiphoniae TaxID=429344 RepID=A0A316E691_9FLAO|nr:DUF2357 domain-containing protein [Maribacter polysiphoniae]MBD1259309.1 DUF2357 domain-containing protein [Maribacter polysiphoniae]PWK24869.1 hypothetical protein LX92_01235 [Maribacter polysiphoniae]
MKTVSNIEINLDSIQKGLRLWIDARRSDSLFDAAENASVHNEARFQLVEGCSYDFQISDPGFILGDVGQNIIQGHKRTTNLGTIMPNIFVGTLSIPLLEKETLRECCKVELEVQSIKSAYREDYRDMLELITEKCTDLLLQASSPVSQYFGIDYTKDSQTLYQKFSFIKSLIGTEEFAEAIHRIVKAPTTKWAEAEEEKDIRNARRFSNSNIKEILKRGNRTKIPEKHYLRSYGLETLPERISTIRKTDSVDTPENRFIKHALENFLKFSTDINNKAREFGHKKMENESELMIRELENQLHHSFFKDISRPTTLKLNSPVLQRKEGYREVLRVWLMFDLAAKLIWTGGNDIYSGGKKDIATMYEYWLFFKLLDLFQSIFEIDPKDISDLIKETPDGLNLQIKQGKFTALRGVYYSRNRKINIRFNYNRTFSGKKTYPNSGSWTTTLRPDYTLSLWPYGISEAEAEKQELIVHVHFDAKYKIANLTDFLEQNIKNDLDEEKVENKKGIYKNADLLKMHAYKDAIRRTGGAYVLYPGDRSINQKGFHEIIPGLGAFPVKPSKTNSGIGELKAFILEIIEHFINRASQREKIAYRTFDIYKNPPESDNIIKEPLPEPYNTNRDLIPDNTFVLLGYYNSHEQYNWIQRTGLYNFRMGSGAGSLILDKETVSSRYLLLHTSGDTSSGDLWKIVSKGPKVYSKDDLIKKDYPNPSQNNYLVIQIEPVTDTEFKNVSWNFRKLENYSTGRASAFPFTTSLTELMKNKIS